MRRARTRLAGIAVNVALLALLAGYVGWLAYPASEATRLRNALLFDVGAAADVQWTPASVPASFKEERQPPSPRFAAIVSDLNLAQLQGDWSKALAIAGHLSANAKDTGPIQSDLASTYDQITARGGGYCADFTQVYLALAHAAGLFAREWAFSFDGFGGRGHAFIEVYDRERGRWSWLDVYNNVHAVDATTAEPLSAEDFRSYAVGARKDVVVQRNGPGRLGYPNVDKLLEYYRRGASEWYLWAGNAVFAYEDNALVRAGTRIAPAVGQLAAIGLGVHPRIVAVPNEGNRAQIERMATLKATLWMIAVLGALLVLALIWQVWMYLRSGVRMDIAKLPEPTVQ